jgi:hypothetical protein
MVRLLRLVVPVGRGRVRSVSGPITVNAVEGETHGRGGARTLAILAAQLLLPRSWQALAGSQD